MALSDAVTNTLTGAFPVRDGSFTPLQQLVVASCRPGVVGWRAKLPQYTIPVIPYLQQAVEQHVSSIELLSILRTMVYLREI